MQDNWFSLHHHSKYSITDGMGVVEDHARQAKELGYQALALTDHGNMAGVAELYRACRKYEIQPLPGIEAYAGYGRKTRKTFHLGLVAVTEQGYLNLVKINNQMMQDFYYKPLLDLTRIDRFDTEGVILTTGCFFGVAMSAAKVDPVAPLNVISTLAQYFDVYVEAQSHGIEEPGHSDVDDQLLALQWSRELGLPLVLGQDCHYIYPQQRRLHDTMKTLTSWSDDPDSATFPGEYGFHMIDSTTARKTFEPTVWKAGMEGMGRVLEKASVRIPLLERFDPILVKRSGEAERIREMVFASSRLPRVETIGPEAQVYIDQAEDELEVIEEFGFAGYMLLVKDIVDHLDKNKIRHNTRGSAAGSLVCYLLGISELDPLRWGLLFERFLSRNRKKLPDIDLDVNSSRRQEVLDHLRETYVVTAISNYNDMKIVEEMGKFKGSALQRWKQAQRKMGQSEVPDQHVFDGLKEMCGSGDVINTRGKNASGLVVAPDSESMKWMPLAVIGSEKDAQERYVTAMDMNSVEAMGYVKVDILGVKALDAIDVALDMLDMEIELEDIPLDDMGVYAMLSDGMTEGVFQLEGWAAKKGMRRMQPRQIEDIVAAMALFRPAVMDSGATDRYIRRMHKQRAADEPVDWGAGYHSDIAEVIRDTYGEIIYQEQVIQVLKNLGFGPEDLGSALKAVKASNNKVSDAQTSIGNLMRNVESMSKERGWKKSDLDWLQAAFDAYANYGFNRAHAASYGLMAYRTAWLIFHYPGHFWKGMIIAHGEDDDKVKEYTVALSNRGFARMPVDVNTSGVHIKVDIKKKRIYPSLTTIKQIGKETATAIERRAPYESLVDLAVKLNGTRVSGIKDLAEGVEPGECSGAIGLLAEAGALRSLV
jgi:DNA polymerase III subunit alpha